MTQISPASSRPRTICNRGWVVVAAARIDPDWRRAMATTKLAKNQYRIITTINTLYSPARCRDSPSWAAKTTVVAIISQMPRRVSLRIQVEILAVVICLLRP